MRRLVALVCALLLTLATPASGTATTSGSCSTWDVSSWGTVTSLTDTFVQTARNHMNMNGFEWSKSREIWVRHYDGNDHWTTYWHVYDNSGSFYAAFNVSRNVAAGSYVKVRSVWDVTGPDIDCVYYVPVRG